jgi:hypothetical protein
MEAFRLKQSVASFAIVAIGAMVALLGFLLAAPVAAATCGTGGTAWQLGTESGSILVLDTADNWNSGNACLTIGSNGENFTIQSQTVNTPNENPVAYPDTNIGCEGGYCTSTTNQRQALPSAYGTIDPKVTATWVGPDNASGHKYDQLIDNQFSSDCTTDTNPTFDINIAIYTDTVSSGTHGDYANLGLADSSTGPTFTVPATCQQASVSVPSVSALSHGQL